MEKTLPVTIPQRPNFIKVGEQMIPVAEFSDKELEDIGKSWTMLLIAEAQHKRNATSNRE